MLYPLPISKLRIATQLLKEGVVRVVLNANVPEVDVPDYLIGRDKVPLDIGYSMPVPIPDLYLDENGFSATLLFKGYGRRVFVPWTAVYSIYLTSTGQGAVWGEDMPDSVKAELIRAAEGAPVFGVTPKSMEVGERPGANVVNLAEFRARRQAKKDGLS